MLQKEHVGGMSSWLPPSSKRDIITLIDLRACMQRTAATTAVILTVP